MRVDRAKSSQGTTAKARVQAGFRTLSVAYMSNKGVLKRHRTTSDR